MTIVDTQPSTEITLPAMPNRQRLDWVDNLRTLMILLVVNMHACVTYSHVGSWYFNAPPEPSIGEKIPFAFWQAHLQSFFMGLLFFIAGYYADRSLSRRGGGAFVVERLRRLGIPTLLYMLAVDPFIIIVLHPGFDAPSVGRYYRHALSHLRFVGDSGPMWFAFALLIFSVIFAAVQPRMPKSGPSPLRFSAGRVVGLGLGIGLLSFLVRTVQPQGTNILNFQLCYFAQYVVVFVLGILVSRQDGLNAIATSPLAKKIGWCALALGPIVWLAVVAASLPIPKHGPLALDGGWNPIALAYAVWEQVTGVGLAIGVMAFCASKLNVRTKLSAWLSDRSFAVYFLHPPVLIAISLLAQPVRTGSVVMAAFVTIAALIASFAIADLAKRVPRLKSVL